MTQFVQYRNSLITAPAYAPSIAIANNGPRLLQLETKVRRWTNQLSVEQGALSQKVPRTITSDITSPSIPGLLPVYRPTPLFDVSRTDQSSPFIRSLVPENSVVLQVQGVPMPVTLRFTEEQSEAITASFTRNTNAQFAKLNDERGRIVARTLVLAALSDLQRGVILSSEFSFVIAKILQVVKALVLPKIKQTSEQAVPSKTTVPDSKPAVGAVSTPKETEVTARYEALKVIERHPKARQLQEPQKEVLARIAYRTWEIQVKGRITKESFIVYLNAASKAQWTEWIDSAKDSGIALEFLRGWPSILRRRSGELSDIVISVRLALPDSPEAQAIAAQLLLDGKTFEQAIEQAKTGRNVQIAELDVPSYRALSSPGLAYTRNPKSLGSKKLHHDLPISVANKLDEIFPNIDWRVDQNPKTKNFVVRSGPTTGKKVLGSVTNPNGLHNVWTITPTNRDYASTQALKRLNPNTIEELNKRYGEGQWSCRPKGEDTIKIISKAGSRPLLVEIRIESASSQIFVTPTLASTRITPKEGLSQAVINHINVQVGRSDWIVQRTKAAGVLEIVDPTSKIILGKLTENAAPPTYGYAPVNRVVRPAKDYTSIVGSAFVKQVDQAFGQGTWRLEKAGVNRYQIHRIAAYLKPGEAYLLGSMTTTNGGATWTLFKSSGAKRISP